MRIVYWTCILFVLFISNVLNAQENNEFPDVAILFSNSELTVKQIFDELNKLPEINIIYSSNENYLNVIVSLKSNPVTFTETIRMIREQTPVEIIKSKKHFIVRKRKLKDTYYIEGRIKSKLTQEGLIAAQILVDGTYNGTIADEKGRFKLEVEPGEYILACSYMGYEDKRIKVNLYQDIQMELDMEKSSKLIPEVNIVGQNSEIKDYDYGRAIDKIEGKEVNQLNTNNVNDALHGRLNGVWATKVSGAPGDQTNIRIRGISSFLGGSDPVYVVDGMIVSSVNSRTLGIADLNTHDVESITVLKDAASTALFGFLGGNGVVIVETKKGGGKTQFNLQVKKGIQYSPKRYPLMNSRDFLATLDSSDSKINTDFYDKYPRYYDSLGNVAVGSDNFQEELFQLGHISEMQFSGKGSVKSVNYYISGNYYFHKGVIANSDYRKYSIMGNFSKTFGNRFTARLIYRGSKQENKNNLNGYKGNNVILNAVNYEPAYRTTSEDYQLLTRRLPHIYGTENNLFDSSMSYLIPPDDMFYKQKRTKDERINSVKLEGTYLIKNGFSLTASLNLSSRNIRYKSFIPATLSGKNEKNLSSLENVRILSQQYDLAYAKQFKNQSFNALLRYRNFNDNVFWDVDSSYIVGGEGINSSDDVYTVGSQSIYGQSGVGVRHFNSFIFNINYNYKEKYFISFLLNYDNLENGVYAKQNYLFKSVAINWDLAKEEVLHLPRWVNYFNVFANYGESGNYPLSSFNNVRHEDQSFLGEYEPLFDKTNYNLTHEHITEINLGSEVSGLKDRVILHGNYFFKEISDLIIDRPLPAYMGGGTSYGNIGEMQNAGLELSIELKPISNNKFEWWTKFGASSSNQIITKLYNSTTTIDLGYNDELLPDFIAEENESIGAIYGFSYQGKWEEPNDDETTDEDSYPSTINHMGLTYLKIDTLDPNNLNGSDITIIGNTIPKYTFNWLNVISYKNFTCEMLWYGAFGVDKYNATRASTYNYGTNRHLQAIIADGMNFHTDRVFYQSSYFVEDASFIRLKTLSFIYTPEKKIASRIGIQYKISFENLITITKYTGYDPEATVYTRSVFNDNAIDRGSYPNPIGAYLTVNLSF